jgi:hypothetical protein
MRTSLLTRAAAATAIAATTALVMTGTADAAVAGPRSHPTSLSILAPKAGAKHAGPAAAKAGSTAAAKARTKSAKAGSTAAAKAGNKAAKARHRNKAIHGVLKSGKTDLAREVVFLDRVGASNKLTVVGKALTNKAGVAAFVVSRKTAAKYVLVFKGTKALAPSHSGIVIVKAS